MNKNQTTTQGNPENPLAMSIDRIVGEDDDDISPPTWLPDLLRMDRERAEMEAREKRERDGMANG